MQEEGAERKEDLEAKGNRLEREKRHATKRHESERSLSGRDGRKSLPCLIRLRISRKSQ
jgi:hypothetical protein